uniref:Secreted protein n=1 Tax=Panstrongylus lignarius TaxID=156445 RepID=A0A224XZM8_9HEMI
MVLQLLASASLLLLASVSHSTATDFTQFTLTPAKEKSQKKPRSIYKDSRYSGRDRIYYSVIISTTITMFGCPSPIFLIQLNYSLCYNFYTLVSFNHICKVWAVPEASYQNTVNTKTSKSVSLLINHQSTLLSSSPLHI